MTQKDKEDKKQEFLLFQKDATGWQKQAVELELLTSCSCVCSTNLIIRGSFQLLVLLSPKNKTFLVAFVPFLNVNMSIQSGLFVPQARQTSHLVFTGRLQTAKSKISTLSVKYFSNSLYAKVTILELLVHKTSGEQ